MNAFAGLIILATIARTLGTTAVGEYTLILNYLGLFFILIDFGANAIVVKQLIDTQDKKIIISKLLTIRLIWATILSLIAIALVWILPQSGINQGYNTNIKTGVTLGAGVFLVMAILSTSNAVFQAKKNYAYVALINAVSATIQILLTYAFLQSTANLQSIIIAYLISGCAGAFTAYTLITRIHGKLIIKIDKNYTKQLLVETLPISITMLTNLIYFRIDSFILPIYRSLSEVGQYNIAYKVFDNILSIPTFASNALYPILLEKYKNNSYSTVINKSLKTYTSIAILITAVTYVVAPLIVLLLTGEYLNDTINYIRILSAGTIFFFLSSLLMMLIIIKNKQKHLIWIYGLNMIITIIGNLTLIPIYGAYASAYLTIALEAVVCILATVVLLKNK